MTFDGGSRVSFDDDSGLDFMFWLRFNERLGINFSFAWQRIDYRVTVRSS